MTNRLMKLALLPLFAFLVLSIIIYCNFAERELCKVQAQNERQASVGEIDYDNFATALNDVKSGETIYCYVDYSSDFTIPQGVIFNGGTQEFSGYVTNNGTIENGKFTKESSGATNEEEDFSGFDDLLNGGTEKKFGVINNGTINNGVYLSRIENNGIINNGTFNNDLTNNQNAKVLGGIYYGTITNLGSFDGGETINQFNNDGLVNGGKISTIENNQNGIINGGAFTSFIKNYGTINNLKNGDIVLEDWCNVVNNGTVVCNFHLRIKANQYVCNCRLCAKTRHIVVLDEYVEPTCTQTGLTEGYHCSACQEVFAEQEIIDELGHTYITKHNDGEHWEYCHCGDIVNKTKHIDLNDDKVCDDCGYKFQLPALAVAGIVIGSTVVTSGIAFLVYWFVIRKRKKHF